MPVRSSSAGSPIQVALGVSGGIAAYKAAEVLRCLQRAGCSVRVAMTRNACRMITPLTFRALSGQHVIVDDFSADNPDPIAHITFSQTVDLFLVAPATANVLAKFASGVANDFLTTTYLACTAPVVVAPAMNSTMWNHAATRRNIKQLRDDGVKIIEPDAGEMACGSIGPGRLSEPEKIVSSALEFLKKTGRPVLQHDLTDERILLTVGATREEIDPVRFISNRSSGRMGFALAEAALSRGAEVRVIAGFTSVPPPPHVVPIRAPTAGDMLDAVVKEIDTSTVFIAAAAVSDYRPRQTMANKLKKSEAPLSLELERTPDILLEAALRRKNGMLIIGFAAETENLVSNAQEKLKSKRLDLVVANDVSRPGAGFDTDTNAVTLITDADAPHELPMMSKLETAHSILDEVVRLRRLSRQAPPTSGSPGV